MKLTIFKPNPRSSGGLAAFEISRDGTLYVNLIPQTGWDKKQKRGSFKNAQSKAVNFKLGVAEAGDILYAIRTGNIFSAYHSIGDKSTRISLGIREVDYGPQDNSTKRPRFLLSANSKNGSDTRKCSCPLEAGEAEALSILLERFVVLSMEAAGKESQQNFEAASGGGQSRESGSSDDGLLGDDDSDSDSSADYEQEEDPDDIPF